MFKNINLKRQKSYNTKNYIIINDFNATNIKKCKCADKINNKIYQQNLILYNKINTKVKNSLVELKSEPLKPPSPNNYERLCLWKKKSDKVPNNEYAESLIYLISKGYRIKLYDSDKVGIDTYNVIETRNKINRENHDIIKDNINTFQNTLKLANYRHMLDKYNLEDIIHPKIIKNKYTDKNINQVRNRTLSLPNNTNYPSNQFNLNLNYVMPENKIRYNSTPCIPTISSLQPVQHISSIQSLPTIKQLQYFQPIVPIQHQQIMQVLPNISQPINLSKSTGVTPSTSYITNSDNSIQYSNNNNSLITPSAPLCLKKNNSPPPPY